MRRLLLVVLVGVAALAVGAVAQAGHRGFGHRGRFAGHHGVPAGWHPVAYPAAYPLPAVEMSDPPLAAPEEPEEVTQNRRYLKVKNDTGEKLTVWVRYRTQTVRDEWKWYPAGDEALCYELAPGQETYLSHEGWRVNASRVRIWAQTASGEQMDEYKDKDLWLVPEEDDDGEHTYLAAHLEDFTFTFSADEP
jgi:hypothetical protein